MDTLPQIFVGIDVSKNFLDVNFYPLNKVFRVTNDSKGIKQLLQKLKKYRVSQVVFEATGGYEYLLKKALEKHNYKSWLVEPKRIRAFIVSEGIRAKTDKIDAKMIALFASQKKSYTTKVSVTKDSESLHALTRRRVDLIKMITQEKNRASHPAQQRCKSEINKHIKFLQRTVESLDQKISKLIKQDKHLLEKNELITSVPGVGHVTSNTLIAHLPELGLISNKRISALVGVAPMINQSGILRGTATIKGGRKLVRRSMYMAATVAIRFNSVLKEFYERLRRDGKTHKVAITAVIRKLIVILNTMIQKGERWQVA